MPPSNPDPLFWPLLFVVLIVAVFALAMVKVVSVLARREPQPPRDLRQEGGDKAKNVYDASSHTTIQVRDINIGAPKVPGPD